MKPLPLPLPDQRLLDAAQGWLGLGDFLAANEELDNITPELRAHPVVLAVRYEVYAKAKNWDGAFEIAQTLVKMLPNNLAAWINLAYATRRKTGGGIAEAKKILLDADRTDLTEFLFGSERANLKEVGAIITEFQSGICFYCHRPLKGEAAHVDHFVPWSRYPVDLGHNFVLAHATCNGKKSDRLAAAVHLDAWCEYQQRNAKGLAVEFDRFGIINDFQSTLRIVNWAYNQTFASHGLTWLRNQELQPLTDAWSTALMPLLN